MVMHGRNWRIIIYGIVVLTISPPTQSKRWKYAQVVMPSHCCAFLGLYTFNHPSLAGGNCSSAAAPGLYAIMYAVLHVIIFIDLDNGLAWSI